VNSQFGIERIYEVEWRPGNIGIMSGRDELRLSSKP